MISTRKNCLLLLVAASFFVGAFPASANLAQVLPAYGNLDRWSALSLGTMGSSPDLFSGNSSIQGDVGVAGNGNITMRDNAVINGDLYYRSNGTLRLSGNATITGARFHNQNYLLDNAVNQAQAASDEAADMQPTSSLQDINLSGTQNLTLTGGPGQTVVLSLRNFQMSGNSTLTLQGTANTTFIINVGKNFSLANNARIILSGVQWNDVLFNVRGSGSTVKLSGNSILQGVLMANRRTVQLRDQASVSGSIIASRILLRDGAHVTHPPTTSP
jgi:cytoskeletal protein CcmA (bactofilin family)